MKKEKKKRKEQTLYFNSKQTDQDNPHTHKEKRHLIKN